MSGSKDSRILEPAGGDSDDDMEPDAGHDGDDQQMNDVNMGAVGGDAPDGQPGKAQGVQPVGAALPPLVASLGGRTIRVCILLDDALVPAPPGMEPLRVHLACPHCHTIPMVSGWCCSNVGERKPSPCYGLGRKASAAGMGRRSLALTSAPPLMPPSCPC